MARSQTILSTFNRGLISPLGLARKDLERTDLSAETMTNWMPRHLGSMMLRPGTEYIGNTASNNKARYIPFVFATDDTALIEITNGQTRVWVDDALVTRPSVSTTITNGGFSVDLTGWTDNDEAAGASSIYNAEASLTYMDLFGDGRNASIRTQEVTVAVGDQNVEHVLEITIGEPDQTDPGLIEGSKVTLKVGSTDGDDDYIAATRLDVGYHSLSFTPTGNFWIQFSNRARNSAMVQNVAVGSAGVMTITSPWAEVDLGLLQWDQSGDIVYVACAKTTDNIGYPPYKIERRSPTSWSVVKYYPEDGPLEPINSSGITVSAAGITSHRTLTASSDLFKSTDEGRLIRMDSNGQFVTVTTNAENNFSDSIRVTGITTSRIFTIELTGTWVATVTLQRSFSDPDGTANWVDVTTYTVNTTTTYDDTLDNQIAWYRIGVKTGDYTSGTVTASLEYTSGSIVGYGRIYNVASATSAQISILSALGNTDATENWYWGSWSDLLGYPTSVALHEGRLGWFGRNKTWLTISDAYESFDQETVGDSGPITRTIGSGPSDTVDWALPLTRLTFGTAAREYEIRSSKDDEPLTPSAAGLKSFGTQGSANVRALQMDKSGLYVQRGGIRLQEIGLTENWEYSTTDLTVFNPEIGSPEITHIALQRQPDTRVHCVRSDGTVAMLLHDNTENVSCWIELTVPGTDAAVEDIVVLPGADGTGEDSVYYAVKRTVNGSTVRFLEKWSLESECQGGTLNKQVDAHLTGTVSGGLMTGLSHLEGETVAVWVNGADAGTYTVSGGDITGVTADGSAVAGLPYTAQWKSAKLGDLLTKKNLMRLGVILYNTHYQGLQYGPDFSSLDNLPMVKDGTTTADDTIHGYDEETFSFDGLWDSDSRLCLQAASPRPCTLLAALIELET
jgi:hypothetical protein